MVFNATFNNILFLLVEKTEVPRENHQSVANDWQTLSHNVIIESLCFVINSNVKYQVAKRGHRGRDRMVVEFTTTCAISAYHH
jgi:hypothetical protein